MSSRIAVVGHKYRHYYDDKLVEWIDAESIDAIRLVGRVRNRFVRGVVLVRADLTHGISRPILDACRRYGIPCTMCEKGTPTRIKSALDTIGLVNERL